MGPDLEVAALAGWQGGVVARSQLLDLGVSPRSIDRRLADGRLHRRHRGVYSVGHGVVGAAGVRWAAVLASGPGAVLSDAAAAAALALRASAATVIDVTVPATGRMAQHGIRLHRRRLAADEVTALDGLPVTTAARTLLDLARAGSRGRRLAQLVDRALALEHTDLDGIGVLLDRYAGRPGTPALRLAVDAYRGGDARSVLELLLGDVCDRAGLPRPQENVVVAGWVRDFYWPAARLVVEADSFGWHRAPAALDDDRERDVTLALAGIRCLRFTYAQVTRRRPYVAAALSRALASDFSAA